MTLLNCDDVIKSRGILVTIFKLFERSYVVHHSCKVFTSQENVVTNSGAHLSFHPNCHHQIAIFQFQSICKLWSRSILNIKSNFIPNETMNFGDRDPPWLNKNIEKND